MPHSESALPRPRILFIDAYDSYTNNIVALLQTELDADVRVLKIDTFKSNAESRLHDLVDHFDAIVCGPGPGNVAVTKDVGVMRHVWTLPSDRLLPVLGICLGFQSLAATFGAKVERLNQPQHGLIRDVEHVGLKGISGTIFDDVGSFKAVLYQSWFVDAERVRNSSDLLPLAWIERNEYNPSILVGVQHATKPFTGLQYHPESICTDLHSRRVIRNWYTQAVVWNLQQSRVPKPPIQLPNLSPPTLPSLLSSVGGISNRTLEHLEYRYRELPRLPSNLTVPDLVEGLQKLRTNNIVLESANSGCAGADNSNRFSIIAIDVDECQRIDYTVGDKFCRSGFPSKGPRAMTKVNLSQHGGSIWSYLATFMDTRKVSRGLEGLPFWGGLMGYTTYELGLEDLGVLKGHPLKRPHSRPDLSFAFVTKSLVVDHWTQRVYAQQLVSPQCETADWLAMMEFWLLNLAVKYDKLQMQSNASNISIPITLAVEAPDETAYEASVERCQSLIRQGESYELCLTSQTHVTLAARKIEDTAWSLYKKLRKSQPAPFASFIRLGAATLVSSSPERFLTWNEQGTCEMRPMKGTVKKSAAVSTLAQAEQLLRVPKEIAENLMIVDLTRHDMQKVCPPGNVQVPKAMVVQEYASVFQMISIVQGQMDNSKQSRHTGLDMLAAALPPGSMTGAPKFRSCQLLRDIEGGRERSLYSGVVGYIDVGGRADFSVTIRSMFHWDDEDNQGLSDTETWHIGAGGAVTNLSSPVDERKEMQAKLAGTLGVICSGSA